MRGRGTEALKLIVNRFRRIAIGQGRERLRPTPRPGPLRAEALDRFEVGEQARLLVLFDGSPAPREPSALEIGPGTGGDAEWADRAEAEGLALVLVFEVHPAELGLDLGGQSVERRGRRDVGVLDEQVIMRRVAPARQDQERPERQFRAPLGGVDRGSTT